MTIYASALQEALTNWFKKHKRLDRDTFEFIKGIVYKNVMMPRRTKTIATIKFDKRPEALAQKSDLDEEGIKSKIIKIGHKWALKFN